MSGRLAARPARLLADRLPEPVRQRLDRLRRGESPALTRPVSRPAPRGVTPEVVTEFDAHAVRAGVLASVTGTLDTAGLGYVLLPRRPGRPRHVAVAADERTAALAALRSAMSGPGRVIDPAPRGRARAGVVRAYRVLAAPGGQVLCGAETGCEIGFWPEIPAGSRRPEGGTHEPGARRAPSANGITAYLSGEAWRRAAAAPNHWTVAAPPPDVTEVTEPVDVVVTWVDGDDPAWRARRNRYAPGDDHNDSAGHASRYAAGRDELRYALRSVAMYAGWVRRIHLVTDDQVPAWLDVEHPAINLVDHRDIFADPSALPVFNSHAIESRLHHIDGLAEHYLYLNDDMFLGRPVEPELFYGGNGIEKVFWSKDTIDLDPPTSRDLPAITAAKNGRALIEREFGVTVHRKYQHAAHPQLRSVVAEMEKRHPELFETVARSRFRHPDDHAIPSSLQHSYALALGRAVTGQWRYAYQDIGRATTPRALDNILRRRPESFCLNDMGTEEIDPDAQREALRRFFGEYFPLPAPWEIPGR